MQPGKHLLLLDIALSGTTTEGRKWSGNLTKTQELDVGIFGESELAALMEKTLLGHISVLLLPGLLLICVFATLRRITDPKLTTENDSRSDIHGYWSHLPTILAGSVVVSMVMWLLWWAFTSMPFGQKITGVSEPRNILHGRSFVDIAILWTAAYIHSLSRIWSVSTLQAWNWTDKSVSVT